jgi:hypothetical protein
LPLITLHQKNGLKLGIIASCILIPFLFSYAENSNKVAENGAAPVNKSNQQSVPSKPDISKDLKQIQTILALLKFNPGPIDGILGKKTTKAIRAFQLDIGVPVTGKIDKNLKLQLDKAYRQSVIRTKEQIRDETGKPPVSGEKPRVTASQDIKLFSEPRLKGVLVGEAKPGTEFAVICKTDNWFLVTTKNDSNCWVHESWITMDSQTLKEVKALIECDSLKALKLLATKQRKELGTGKELEVNKQKEIEVGSQKELTPKDRNLKPENQYLKYIKLSFPIVAIIFLAYFYRIWARSHEKKRDVKRSQKAKSGAQRSEKAKPEEKYEALSVVQELEEEMPDHSDGKADLDHQDPIDYQDPSHPGYITPVVRRKVWIRNKGQCAACSTRKDLQYDYIVPISEGGSNTLDNLQLLCKTCNQKKSVKND